MLRLKNISKKFGWHTALKSIDLIIAKGEIHGLAGLNGSGKSTLLNILFGNPIIFHTGGHTGEILLQGKTCNIKSPQTAIMAGFGMIHQEFAIIPEMSVAENINLTREPTFSKSERLFGLDFALIDTKNSEKKATETLDILGVHLAPHYKAKHLPMNAKQFVEIAREISRNDLKILLLDEPTAVLNSDDSALLMRTIKDLAQSGVTIIYVSHRLDELFFLCDNLTVLRNGEISGQFSRENYDQEAVTDCMIGGSVTFARKATRIRRKGTIISMCDFSVVMPGEALNGLDLDIKKGEILGIISLSGHGKMAIGPGLMGQFASSGKITINGQVVQCLNPATMISRGLFMLPEDRRQTGLLLHHSLAENIIFSAMQCCQRFLRHSPYLPCRFPDRKKINAYSAACIQAYEIACTGMSQKVIELSGGNQQKVCIARALAMDPEILIINEPTRGIDINAKERILDLFITTNEKKGTTLIVASSELDELKRICDRIAVLYQGRLSAILPSDADDRVFVHAMSGEKTVQ